MKFLTRFSLRNIGFLLIMLVLLIGGGIYSARNMYLEEYPNISVPYLSITVPYPGATSTQVLTDVAKPLEAQLSTLKGLNNLYVTASENSAHIILEFTVDTSVDDAQTNVYNAIAKTTLPDTIKNIKVTKQGPTAQPIYLFSVSSTTESSDAVKDYVTNQIEPALTSISGVSNIDINGTSDKSIYIKVDAQKLKDNNLTLDKVKQALLANNITTPIGTITIDGKDNNIQVNPQLTSLDTIKNINLIMVQQSSKGITDAFSTIGDGLGEIGSSVGKIGSVTAGNTEANALLSEQIQIMSGINGLSTQLLADQSKLQKLAETPPANMTPAIQQQMKQIQQDITTTSNKIKELQTTLTTIQIKINEISNQNAKTLKNMETPKSTTSTPSTDPAFTISTIPLSSIADVTYEVGQQGSYTRLNGHPAVVVSIEPNSDANTVDIIKNVKSKLTELNIPKSYSVVTLRDESVNILQSVNGMLREAMFGALLAALVSLFFLRSIRTTLVAIISIPTSIFITMIIMKSMGYTLNIMTLAGISVAVGRVVDDSIVVIENIYRRIKTTKQEERDNHFIEDATSEVGNAITSSTMTTIAVFLPMAFVPGIVGKFFAPFAWSVVIAILFSLLIAVSVVPMLSKLLLLKIKPIEKKNTLLQRGYHVILNWSLNHRLIVIACTIILFIGTFLLLPKIPVSFFPKEKIHYYNLSTTLPVGTSVDTSNDIAKKIEQIIKDTKAVNLYNVSVGAGNITVQITMNAKANTTTFEQTMNTNLKTLGPNIQTTLSAIQGIPVGNNLTIIVNGPNHDAIQTGITAIKSELNKMNGISKVQSSLDTARSQISVVVDNAKAAQNALYPANVADTIHNMVNGSTVMDVQYNGSTTDVILAFKGNTLTTLNDITTQKITNAVGDTVAIGDIAKVEQKQSPASIQRLNQVEYDSLQLTIASRNVTQVQKDIVKQLKNVSLSKGVTYYLAGEANELNNGFQNIIMAIGLSIILVYLAMMLAFGEMLAPFAILFSLPFIFVGVVVGLFLTGESLGMPALVGILMLVGIVVTNAIVLIDRVKQNQAKGLHTKEAILKAGNTRIRPILMTAISTIGALIPLAISTDGGLISRSLGIVVISGLTSSTILTLVIVPIVYLYLDELKSLFQKIKRSKNTDIAV